VGRINLAQDRNKWRVFVMPVMNVRCQNSGNCLTAGGTLSF